MIFHQGGIHKQVRIRIHHTCVRIWKFMFRKRYDLHKVDDINRKIVRVLRLWIKSLLPIEITVILLLYVTFFERMVNGIFVFRVWWEIIHDIKITFGKAESFMCVCLCVVSVCVAAAGPSPCCYNRQQEEKRRKKNKKKKKKKTKFNEPCLVYTYIHSMEEYVSVEKVQIYR